MVEVVLALIDPSGHPLQVLDLVCTAPRFGDDMVERCGITQNQLLAGVTTTAVLFQKDRRQFVTAITSTEVMVSRTTRETTQALRVLYLHARKGRIKFVVAAIATAGRPTIGRSFLVAYTLFLQTRSTARSRSTAAGDTQTGSTPPIPAALLCVSSLHPFLVGQGHRHSRMSWRVFTLYSHRSIRSRTQTARHRLMPGSFGSTSTRSRHTGFLFVTWP